MRTSRPIFATLALAVSTLATGGAAEDPKQIAFFESKIRPLLAEHCYKCHSAAKGEAKGGLTLDTQGGWMDGGDSGPALIAGEVKASLLIEAVEQSDPDFAMPPKYKLADHEIAVLKRWVAMGAPDPRDGTTPKIAATTIDIEEGRKFWSFQLVTQPAAPAVADKTWPKTGVDAFVRAKQEAAGIAPVAAADRRTLIRRATYDLVGLPPRPSDINAFIEDPQPDAEAFAKVVDRLLASEHFGERWGRHWLDVVRYGESMGRTRNYPFPFAWRYRDYVIAAFNTDKPYDQFVREQLAGDLLKSDDPKLADERVVATGLLALGSMDLNERDRQKFKMDQVDDQIDVTSRAFMGLTASCARCHDHKFDPLPTADYYALAGIFGSSDSLTGYASRQGGNNQKVNGDLLVSLKSVPAGEKIDAGPLKPSAQERNVKQQIAERQKEIKTTQEKVAKATAPERKKLNNKLAQLRKELSRLQKQVKNLVKARNSGSAATANMAMGVRDSAKVDDCAICVRGDVDNRGAKVPRGVPQVLAAEPVKIAEGSSGRLELARWMADPSHPLTSRVMANRVWHHLFGRGIVATVDNFGETGERPTHPQLLDHLASRFAGEHAWSVKSLVREIMLSRTYMLSSTHDDKAAAVDPDNHFLWRANVRRLEAEALRDAMLTVSGSIDLEPFEGSLVQRLKGGQIGTGRGGGAQVEGFTKRSVYLPIVRNDLPEFLEVFDFAEPASVIGKRDVTTVSTQALYLLNDKFVIDQSRAAAKRLFEIKRLTNREQRLSGAYMLAFGRAPSGSELAAARRYLNEASENGQQNSEAWGGFMQALFASAEFRYVL